MLVFLCITLIILSVIAFKFEASFDGHLDMFENDGFFAVKIFGLQLFRADIKFQSEDLTHNNLLVKSGKKLTEIHLNADKKDDRSIIRIMNYPILDNLLIKRLDLDVRIGKRDDAFFTTLLTGGIRAAVYSVLAFIKSRFNTDIRETFTPEYNSDKFEADYFGIISISIADIIFSYLLSKIRKSKVRKEVRQN